MLVEATLARSCANACTASLKQLASQAFPAGTSWVCASLACIRVAGRQALAVGQACMTGGCTWRVVMPTCTNGRPECFMHTVCCATSLDGVFYQDAPLPATCGSKQLTATEQSALPHPSPRPARHNTPPPPSQPTFRQLPRLLLRRPADFVCGHVDEAAHLAIGTAGLQQHVGAVPATVQNGGKRVGWLDEVSSSSMQLLSPHSCWRLDSRSVWVTQSEAPDGPTSGAAAPHPLHCTQAPGMPTQPKCQQRRSHCPPPY